VRGPHETPFSATVDRVTTGPGRYELTLDVGFALRAHLPLTTPPPDPGAEVSLEVDPSLAAVLDPAARTQGGAGAAGAYPV
jgi:hypothetical protein